MVRARHRSMPLAVRLSGWMILLVTLPMLGTVFFSRSNLLVTVSAAAAQPRTALARMVAHDLEDSPLDAAHPWSPGGGSSTPETKILVVSSEGAYLWHPDPDKVGHPMGDDYPSVVVEAVLSGQEGVFEDPTWPRLHLSFVPMARKNATVVAETDWVVLDRTASAFLDRLNAQIGLLAVLLSLGGGFVLWATVGKPVWRLSEAAERMGKGELETRVDPETMIDDLKDLALTFNGMSDQIRILVANLTELNASLESRVEERTQQLKVTNEELVSVLDHLHATQDQLVQATRFSVQSQLSANLLHELNTPLGASLSAVRSLQKFFTEGLPGSLPLLGEVSDEVRTAVWRLAISAGSRPLHGRRQDRQTRIQWEKRLEESQVPQARARAELGFALGVDGSNGDFHTLASHPQGLGLLELTEGLASALTLFEVIRLSGEKAAEVTGKLRDYLETKDPETDQG